MNFIISANTDVGLVKDTNQDSLTSMVLSTPLGRMAFCVLCDGMGGLAKGEVASASVITAFRNWAINDLPLLCEKPLEDAIIRSQWGAIIDQQNSMIKSYGARQGVRLGTTVVVMLLTQTRYYILNVGDSRAYELTTGIRQITNDQTFIAREIALGHMTPEEAETDSRRNVLLQCVGASDAVYPDMFFGETAHDAIYMLCSDGFRHEITAEEIYEKLQPGVLFDDYTMQQNSISLIELNKQRRERDNITVALVRTF
ncbi:MAG: serine/threonine-protein phosphatase [Bacteroidaceae bacterium]|nr:serine/threonine-protein phosphatase [Bacteroidaceae bacterium]